MGRNTWLTRTSGGGALLSAVLAVWTLLLRAGMSVYRPDVAVLGAVALVLGAVWVWSGSRPVPVAAPRQADPAPPPARLPVEPQWIRRITPWLLGVAVVLPALSVATELAIRPDGDDLRRIAAIQRAGAETAEGKVVDVHRLTRDDPKVAMFSGDVTVEVPVLAPDGQRVTGRVEVRNGHFGMEGGASRRSSPRPMIVLYAPSAPELGGVVDYSGQVGRYAATDSPLAFSLPPYLTVGAFVPGGLLLFIWVMRVTWYAPKADAAARTLREDAAGGSALPAVRARITSARRGDHVSLGDVDGTVRVTSDHKLRFALEDGSEVLAANRGGPPHALALLAATMGERPGWLCGARNWRLIRNSQPVVFVTDEGEVAWLEVDRADFERILAPATPVQPDPNRSTVLAPTPTTVLPGAHWPWLGGLLLSYALATYVLLVPMSWGAAQAATAAAASAAVAAFVFLARRRVALTDRLGHWEVHETRDPELGPA
ncbi:hypothetical protein ACE1OC_40520 [Streptomyces sp. DSM 116496]|uniref:hypothetical protein n=1 Tax=Streptomyces stoeckheimensis TaxID=3344656 RepID=UPI0038B2B1B6